MHGRVRLNILVLEGVLLVGTRHPLALDQLLGLLQGRRVHDVHLVD